MTVSSQTRKAGPYSGTGSTGPFTFSFKVFEASDVLVVKVNNSTNVETTLTLTTDYTVSLNADQNANPGGTITLVSALASGYNMVISSQVPYLQETDLTNQGGFYPEVITDALDMLTIEMQQLKLGVDRSAKLPITSTEDADALVADIVRIADSADNLDTVANNIDDVNTVADSIADVNTVADNIADVNTTADSISSVNTVAGISGNVTTVAGISSNVTTVAGISANVTTVAGISANVTSVAGNSTNINAVAANATNINAVNANKTNIDAVAGNSTNINAVNANKTNIDTVAGKASEVTTVAGISGNVTTVAGISSNVTTVAGISSSVSTVASNNANVTTVAGISADVTEVAGISTDVTEVASISADVQTVADNVTDITNFADVYLGPKSSAPATRNDGSALQVGDLYFNTVDNAMKVYSSGGWVNAASTVNGTAIRQTFTATVGQTSFTVTGGYDAGYIDVFLNGAKLTNGVDVTVSSGTVVVLTVGADAGDVIDIVAYGAFAVADTYTQAQSDAKFAQLANPQTFTKANRGAVVALTDGATITPDFAAGNNFSVTLGGSRTLANPTNIVAGQSGVIAVTQDGTGSRTLAFGGYWKFSSGTAPTLTSTASAVDLIAYYVESSTRIDARFIGDVK